MEQAPATVTARELAEDPATFRRFFEGSTDAMVVTDVAGRIVTVNSAWCALYEFTPAEAVGQTMRLIRGPHTTQDVYVAMWAAIRDPAVAAWRGELINRKKSGEEVPVRVTVTPIRKGGAIVGYMAVSVDLTERKRQEKTKALYDLIVRHDLKAPLAAIRMGVDALLGGFAGALAEPQEHLLRRIARAAQQMSDIIATSLDLEKLARQRLVLSPAEMDLAAAVATSFDTLADTARLRGVTLRADGVREAPVLLDPVHVQRVLDNVVKNAIEAAPRGTTVRATIREGATQAGALGYDVAVHNEGPPIPPEVRATLFHPFGTYGKRGGTGLGIYGVKLTMEAFAGTVSFTSDEAGTVFNLSFPRALPPADETADETPEERQ